MILAFIAQCYTTWDARTLQEYTTSTKMSAYKLTFLPYDNIYMEINNFPTAY